MITQEIKLKNWIDTGYKVSVYLYGFSSGMVLLSKTGNSIPFIIYKDGSIAFDKHLSESAYERACKAIKSVLKLYRQQVTDIVSNAYIYTAKFATFEHDDEAQDMQVNEYALQNINRICSNFIDACQKKLKPTEFEYLLTKLDTETSSVGGDLFYDSNGHGVGFADRTDIYSSDMAMQLQIIAQNMGYNDLYVGDDDQLHLG